MAAPFRQLAIFQPKSEVRRPCPGIGLYRLGFWATQQLLEFEQWQRPTETSCQRSAYKRESVIRHEIVNCHSIAHTLTYNPSKLSRDACGKGPGAFSEAGPVSKGCPLPVCFIGTRTAPAEHKEQHSRQTASPCAATTAWHCLLGVQLRGMPTSTSPGAAWHVHAVLQSGPI